MRQPTLPNRKRPEFRRCPVCEVEFCVRHPDQRWCSMDCVDRAKHRGDGADVMFHEIVRQIAVEKERP
jgi:hypothetical protein